VHIRDLVERDMLKNPLVNFLGKSLKKNISLLLWKCMKRKSDSYEFEKLVRLNPSPSLVHEPLEGFSLTHPYIVFWPSTIWTLNLHRKFEDNPMY
jgi:hypothetical protein